MKTTKNERAMQMCFPDLLLPETDFISGSFFSSAGEIKVAEADAGSISVTAAWGAVETEGADGVEEEAASTSKLNV